GVMLQPPTLTHSRAFQRAAIEYYSVSEYLPEMKMPAPVVEKPRRAARHGESKLAPQEIISLPPAPDNFRQTIVDPAHPEVLQEARPLPNLVADVIAPPVPAAAAERRLNQIFAS